jgi:acyl-CoA reductase-like NAD-dependent aldehyde dehydrogenase
MPTIGNLHGLGCRPRCSLAVSATAVARDDEFVERVADFGKALKVGNGLDPDTQIGPLVSQQQVERVSGYLATARQEGARPVTGGQPLTEGP